MVQFCNVCVAHLIRLFKPINDLYQSMLRLHIQWRGILGKIIFQFKKNAFTQAPFESRCIRDNNAGYEDLK